MQFSDHHQLLQLEVKKLQKQLSYSGKFLMCIPSTMLAGKELNKEYQFIFRALCNFLASVIIISCCYDSCFDFNIF